MRIPCTADVKRVCWTVRRPVLRSNRGWQAVRDRRRSSASFTEAVAADIQCKLKSSPATVQSDRPSHDRAQEAAITPSVQPMFCKREEDARRDTYSPARTKSFSSRWLWHSDLNWRSAFLFFCGSILFAFSSFAGLFSCIASHEIHNQLLVAYPYALGSTLYTWGAYCSVVASTATLRSFQSRCSLASSKADSEQTAARSTAAICSAASAVQPFTARQSLQTGQRLSASEDAPKGEELCSCSGVNMIPMQRSSRWRQRCEAAWLGVQTIRAPSLSPIWGSRRLKIGSLSDHDWAMIDWAALMGVWIGTMLYNVSCITPAVLCALSTPLPPRIEATVLKWAVAVPNVVAGCLFVSGSYSCWAAATRTCNPFLLLQGCSEANLGFLLYVLGSIGFLSGSLLTRPLLVIVPAVLIDEWLGMFAGYFLGSLCFLIGSFLTIAAPAAAA